MKATATTYAVQYTTFVFNGQYMIHGVRQTKWYGSEVEIPAKYTSCVGRKYDNENPTERWAGTVIVRTA